MKKIIAIFILITIMLMMAGCSTTITDPEGKTRLVKYGFIEITKKHEGNLANSKRSGVYYDPRTSICYLITEELYGCGICPYYIIGENGQPEIAIYGVNYTGE